MIYLTLFLTFLMIGAVTFGGGYAMLPMVQEEVAKKGWMTAQKLIDFVAVSESTPGPFAINIATFTGAETGGLLGAVCATFGVVLPSFVIILTVARIYDKFQKSNLVKGMMKGLKPAVVGLIGAALVSMCKTVLFTSGMASFTDYKLYISLGIFAVMSVLAFKKVHPIIIVCLSAGIGIACGYLLF